jgi:hypothetical protein
MKCKNCKFFDETYERAEGVGACRRYAPRLVSGVGTGYEERLFPLVVDDDWCGEYVIAEDRVLRGYDAVPLKTLEGKG